MYMKISAQETRFNPCVVYVFCQTSTRDGSLLFRNR